MTGFAGSSAVFNLARYMERAGAVILPHRIPLPRLDQKRLHNPAGQDGKLHVGVDLGTAYLVLAVLDEKKQPLLGTYRFAQVVRDGLVVDFIGAIDLLREMKKLVEDALGTEINHAATGYPPGVPQVEVRATAHVIEAAGMHCTALIDEPSAANNLLQIRDGAILDVGGGTTGLAVVEKGCVIFTADEPTGGMHFSLVVSGALNISLEEAEELKKDPAEQPRLYPMLRPVMEKVGSIAVKHLTGFSVKHIYLVGGACMFPGMAEVIQDYTGVPVSVPPQPLLVTPIGIAMQDQIMI